MSIFIEYTLYLSIYLFLFIHTSIYLSNLSTNLSTYPGSGVSVYSVHPGGVSTDLGRNIPNLLPERFSGALSTAFNWVAKVNQIKITSKGLRRCGTVSCSKKEKRVGYIVVSHTYCMPSSIE